MKSSRLFFLFPPPFFQAALCDAGERPRVAIPPVKWEGTVQTEVPALKRTAAAIVNLK